MEHKNTIHVVKAQRLTWLSHVERMPKKRVGRPKARWMDNIMKYKAMEIANWERCAQDRNKWK
jgi:hypothetical protein